MTVTAPNAASHVAPVADIRRHFPALARRHGGSPVAYFDGPGGTQVPLTVVDAMREYMQDHNANTHCPYPTSEETDAAISAARAALADFLGASPGEIAFGANMTTLTFHVARALGRGWGPGDEVVVTELDHHANVAPWQAVARERGITLRVVRMDPTLGVLDQADLAAAIGPRTKLVAVAAASNALGTITDVARVTELAHRAGALVYVDAVHFAAHGVVDVAALGCDFLACSSYKFYGPHLGVLYGRTEVLDRLPAFKVRPAHDRWETGTQSFESIAGDGLRPNVLLIHVQPDEGVSLAIGAKVPGAGMSIRTVHMDFLYGGAFREGVPEAYERLILDAMLGDATLFTREDEVEEQWKLVDAIVGAWGRDRPTFPDYAAGSWGPARADELLHRDGRSWRRH